MLRSTETEEESLDSTSNEPAVLLSPKVEETNNITEEKKPPKSDPLKQKVKEPLKSIKTGQKPVKASAPAKAVKRPPPPPRKRLVSVSAPLDKAMEELSLSLGDLDMEPGHDPGLASSDASRGGWISYCFLRTIGYVRASRSELLGA